MKITKNIYSILQIQKNKKITISALEDNILILYHKKCQKKIDNDKKRKMEVIYDYLFN